jgi:uncharacterized protein YqjF (DUF2071 family)
MSFLKAEWRKLGMANYEIDPTVLGKYVPRGTELDKWNGRCYVSLVGFMFKDTRVLGLPVPWHINFEEVNLRFYVRRKEEGSWKRGVVFIREIVPKPTITFVANTLYHEHYVTRRMKHLWENDAQNLRVEYSWKVGNEWQKFVLSANPQQQEIAEGSEEEFITEHYWGYNRVNDRQTTEYEVTHPKWHQYLVNACTIDVDYCLNYGDSFAFLNEAKPSSVLLAEGSKITVESKKTLRF